MTLLQPWRPRLLRVLFSAVIALSLYDNGPSHAQGTASLAAGDGNGQPGQVDITLAVSFNSTVDVSGVNFDYSFDSSRISYVSVSAGPAAQGKSVSSSQPSAGTLRVIVFGLDQESLGNGTLVHIKFNVNNDAQAGTFPLVLSNSAASAPDGSSVSLSTSDGSFTVTSIQASPTATLEPSATPPATETSAPPSSTPNPTATIATGPSATASATAAVGGTVSPTATVVVPTSTGDTPSPSPTGPRPTLTATVGTSGLRLSPTPKTRGTKSTGGQSGNATVYPAELEAAVAATGTALAEQDRAFESAVAATATALAQLDPGRGSDDRPVRSSHVPVSVWATAIAGFLRSPVGLAGLVLGELFGIGLLLWAIRRYRRAKSMTAHVK